VRGLRPWPCAYTFLSGARLLILRGRVDDEPAETRRDGPGTVVAARGDRLVVLAGDATAFRIIEIQPEGRRPMSARDFLAGHPLAPGMRLGPDR
jgi:methionyl-tRNA formyltransferase